MDLCVIGRTSCIRDSSSSRARKELVELVKVGVCEAGVSLRVGREGQKPVMCYLDRAKRERN